MKKKNNSYGVILVIAIIIFIIFFATITQLKFDEIGNSKKALLESYSISYEQFDNIIKKCGFTNYAIEDIGEENNIRSFLVSEQNKRCTVDIINGTIISIDYAGHNLYENGKVINTINDFELTAEEETKYIDIARNAVKSKLNYPNTAKFPFLNEFVTYTDKNHISVKGTVTAKNGFGFEQTYTFEVTIENNTVTNVNLY